MFRLRLVLCLLLSVIPASGGAQEIADRIYYNAQVITADDDAPAVEAIAIGGGKILSVGSLVEVVHVRGAHTEMIDLEGRAVAPGFVDAHSHFSHVGLTALSANLFCPPHGGSASVGGLVATLRRWKDTPSVQEFGLVLGFGFDRCQFGGGRHLSRADLDRVSTDLPVVAIHRLGDRSVLNSRALKLAGIGPDSPAARNGRLARAAHRRALGRILSALEPENFAAMIDAGQQIYVSQGHTTVQDSRPLPAVLAAWPEVAASGRLKVDVIVYPDLVRDRNAAILHGPFRSSEYTNGLRVGGVMLRLDGALRPETARLRASYLRQASGPLTRIGAGNAFDDAQTAALLAAAFHNGWQVIAHVSGDYALAQLLAATRRAVQSAPDFDWRPVLLQAQALAPEHFATIRSLGILPALCPAPPPSHCEPAPGFDHTGMVRIPTGWEERFIAYHDAPAERPDPLRVLTMTRDLLARASPRRESARLANAALKSVTLGPAWQYFEEDRKGSLSPGKLADFVILSANPLYTNGPVVIEETIKEGATVYVRDELAGPPGGHFSCFASEVCFRAMAAAADALMGEESAPTGRSAAAQRDGPNPVRETPPGPDQ